MCRKAKASDVPQKGGEDSRVADEMISRGTAPISPAGGRSVFCLSRRAPFAGADGHLFVVDSAAISRLAWIHAWLWQSRVVRGWARDDPISQWEIRGTLAFRRGLLQSIGRGRLESVVAVSMHLPSGSVMRVCSLCTWDSRRSMTSNRCVTKSTTALVTKNLRILHASNTIGNSKGWLYSYPTA